MSTVNVIGGGLAGSEAAALLADLGFQVRLHEMKPVKYTEAHKSPHLAELVCSNSLKSEQSDSAAGVLKGEMRGLGSILLQAAEKARVPAGKALAVDRERFAATVSDMIRANHNIELIQAEVSRPEHDQLSILATGPLSTEPMADWLAQASGAGNLYFYDAIAPILETASIDMDSAFWADRYSDAPGDYLNCPLTESEYDRFYENLLKADRVTRREFENAKHFESCMPVEELASRGKITLTFGPMRPVGLSDPKSGKRPFAVVQLRKEDLAGAYVNMVGFQTRLKHPEQKRVFSLIPALGNAVFARYGSIHRNTFINAPQCLNPDLSLKNAPNTLVAGQLTGVEGYLESAAMGLYAGLCAAARLSRSTFDAPPATTAMGALLGHLQNDRGKKFQPSNVNFGIFAPLEKKHPKRERGFFYARRAEADYAAWLGKLPWRFA